MNLLDFSTRFKDEESCRAYLKEKREAEGVICKKCGSKDHYWLATLNCWKCKSCGTWTNLRKGTIMEKSKLPVRTWFMCIHLMTSITKSFSALEMQKQLGLTSYESAWYMMQKTRKVMGKRDACYKLKGELELDDAYFKIVDVQYDEIGNKLEKVKVQGRGTDKAKVLVIVESAANPEATGKYNKKRIMGFVKMIVMDELTQESINAAVRKHVNSESSIISDKISTYNKLNEVVENHTATKVEPTEAGVQLPWVHTVISNAKRLFLGVHHSIGKQFLQNYLDEYCYKLNRRNFKSDLFDRMIIAGASDTWY